MIPNFALSLSFEGIALLRRMGPRWARIDDVPLDDPDFDSRVIALRDRAESLDPTGAQVALIIPNEQIRYLDQPDLGGDETARDIAIRTSLDGATPYAVSELKYDYVVTDGHLQIAAVAIETLDEAQSFAVEHGFDPVSFMAQAPEGAFDSAVFFGKAKGWSKAASRPARAISIVEADETALQPLPKPELVAPAAPKPQAAKPDAPKPEAAQPETPKPTARPAATPDAPRAAPAPKSATPTETPAPTAKPDESAQPAALKADAPAPEAQAPKAPAPQAPAPKPTTGVSAPKASAPKVAEPSVPAAPKAPSAPPRPTTAAPSPAPKAPAVPSPSPVGQGAPKAPAVPARSAPAPKAPQTPGQPTAQAPAPRPAAQVQQPKPPAAPAEPDAERPYTFSTIRATRPGATGASDDATAPRPPVTGELKARFTPVAPSADSKTEMPDQPAKAPAPKARTGFFSAPTASALLAQASAAADEAEAARPAGGTAAPAAAQAKRPVLPPKLKGKTKAAAKPGVKPIPKVAAARAAGLAAAPAREAKEDEFLATPAAARKAVPAAGKGQKPGGMPRPSPLAKLAALRGPQGQDRIGGPAVTGAGSAGAAAIPAGMAFNQPSERDRMTVFGARDRDLTGGKPRYLGLMLTAILLLFLAGVAAWATVFLDDGLARLFRSADEPASAIASLPDGDTDVAPAPGDDGVILESATPPASAAPAISARPVARPEGEVQIAAFDPPATAPDPLVAPLAVPTDPRQLTPEEAAASYAASGIWQRAPAKPHRPPEDGVDDVYAASIDPNIQIFDAVALPQSKDLAREPDFQDPGLPPPAGLTFDFDERDLIRATPEGALTPDGLRIFTGRPPVIPPLRGEVAVGPDPELDAPGAIRTRLNAMPRIRPQTRPDDLMELRERSQLGGISRSELAAIRPVMRPPTAQEQAEIDAPEATDQAVRRSLVPVGRPRNMAAIVDNADRSLVPAEPVQTAAAVAPRTVAPQVPSSASVARAATSTNAINLKKINLIGVYGTAENRRALVRLANGKYQKVKVGDRLDGGRVTAIGEEALRYTKGSRNLTLTMPQT
ncbi:hypothetical protein [Mameliella alba]|uniref:Translation initiation factor 2 (IF-2, GTPase) n=1 Tax=Mameliella alba TaxID=561184 RepID=A0A0B3RL65_9RHOB|nr:hypothetical protein [Mameliella alba]KHQ51955.1 Translation initiation factor 2 (IF-2, GTPase) [Mameliella alba]